MANQVFELFHCGEVDCNRTVHTTIPVTDLASPGGNSSITAGGRAGSKAIALCLIPQPMYTFSNFLHGSITYNTGRYIIHVGMVVNLTSDINTTLVVSVAPTALFVYMQRKHTGQRQRHELRATSLS